MASPPLPSEDLEHVLTHTRDLWTEARGQSIFLTGGTGFFGVWLVESFLHANAALGLNARLVVLTRDPAAFARKAPHLTGRAGLEFVAGDVRDFVFPVARFAHVIHAATAAGARLSAEAPPGMRDTIIGGTRRVLEFCAQAGAKKFLYVSSGAVYGPQPAGLSHIPEDYPGVPDPHLAGDAYGEGKRAAELLCLEQARRSGCEFKIARCFAFVGPHLPLDAHYAIGDFIGDAMAGRPIRVKGDGTAIRSYLYAADLAVWLWTILFHGAPTRVYNVGSQNGLPIAELAREVGIALGANAPALSGLMHLPADKTSRYIPDTKRASAELGLRELIPLPEAIRRTASWCNQSLND